MAVIKNGANGALSGKAGSVVFVTDGNTTYARGLPRKSRKKPSVAFTTEGHLKKIK